MSCKTPVCFGGAHGGAVGWGTALQAGRLQVQFLMVSLEFDMIYLLTAVGLSPGGSSTVHIYTQTIHRTTQNKQCIEQHNNLGESGPCPMWPNYVPGVDSAPNRNEYQEYFLGGKGCQCVGLQTLPPSCVDCLEIWEPQPPGTLRACLGL